MSFFNFPEQTNLYHGKVRDVYSIQSDWLVMVASDRISAFDVILPRPIPFKGQVLNQIAAYMLEATKDICPNWLSYHAGKRTLCGVPLPEGLKENDFFPNPIITPSTKASAGHDEDISKEEIIAQGLASAEDWAQLERYTLALFARGKEIAAQQGLILADTKYEFGKIGDTIYLMDEIHTPDSSRYFYADGFSERQLSGEKQKQLSKEFVREWLIANNFMGKEGQVVPEMTDEWIDTISQRYIELFEKVTGHAFKPEPMTNEVTSQKVIAALQQLGVLK
jgi:phosphoribosylaminoimidazole-succinocarboxamide synthase